MTTLKSPQDCQNMQELREAIDDLDRQLVELLVARAGMIDRAIELKQINGWPARIPERVEEVVSKVKATSASVGLDPQLTEDLWRRLIDWSIAREAQVIKENAEA